MENIITTDTTTTLTPRENIIIDTCPSGAEVFWLRACILEALEAENCLGFDPQAVTEQAAWFFPALPEEADAVLRLWQGRQIDISLTHYNCTNLLVEYFRLHPSQDIGEKAWQAANDGHVWLITNPQQGAWYSETELTKLPAGLLEVNYIDGEIESVFLNGHLMFDGQKASPQTILLDCMKTDSLLEVFEDVEATYRLGINPLPQLRELLRPDVMVRFDGSCPRAQRSLIAPKDRTLLSIVLDNDGAVWWAFVPAGQAVDHRQRCSRHWQHGPYDFGTLPRQAPAR